MGLGATKSSQIQTTEHYKIDSKLRSNDARNPPKKAKKSSNDQPIPTCSKPPPHSMTNHPGTFGWKSLGSITAHQRRATARTRRAAAAACWMPQPPVAALARGARLVCGAFIDTHSLSRVAVHAGQSRRCDECACCGLPARRALSRFVALCDGAEGFKTTAGFAEVVVGWHAGLDSEYKYE
jgi:hypothetical protein